MGFKRIEILLAYDNSNGLLAPIVSNMLEMLNVRGFNVDVLELGDGAVPDVELEDYSGLILGCPVPGMGLRRHGPTQPVVDFLEVVEELDEVKVIVFSVYRLFPGDTLENLEIEVQERGGELVASQEIWALHPDAEDHHIPAECMVRIRS